MDAGLNKGKMDVIIDHAKSSGGGRDETCDCYGFIQSLTGQRLYEAKNQLALLGFFHCQKFG